MDSSFKVFVSLEPVRQGESVIANCLPGLRLVHEDRVEVGGGAGRETLALLPQQEVPALLHPLTLLALPGPLLQPHRTSTEQNWQYTAVEQTLPQRNIFVQNL